MSTIISNQAHSALRRFDVTIVGDTNLDLLLYGVPEELPCERELLASDMAIRIGGSGAITAHNLAALGNRVGFITTAAGDDFARVCHTELTDAGVDLSGFVPMQDARTGVTVHLQHQELRHMFTYAGATFRLDYDRLDLAYLSDSSHFQRQASDVWILVRSARDPHELSAALRRSMRNYRFHHQRPSCARRRNSAGRLAEKRQSQDHLNRTLFCLQSDRSCCWHGEGPGYL